MKKTLIVLLVMASSAFVCGADDGKQEAKDANKATDRIQAAATERLAGSLRLFRHLHAIPASPGRRSTGNSLL